MNIITQIYKGLITLWKRYADDTKARLFINVNPLDIENPVWKEVTAHVFIDISETYGENPIRKEVVRREDGTLDV